MKNAPSTSIDAYIQAQPKELQERLAELRAAIVRAAPQATEKMSYQMPTFFLGENLVHFAAYKEHIGFYPSPTGITAFAKELKGYETSKGAIRFPLDQPLPLALVGRIVRFRVKEALARAKPAKVAASRKAKGSKAPKAARASRASSR
jgi:uncharacterized protein YdhG (YjbR/CyaY superfamily)